jgi:hypothetical protein
MRAENDAAMERRSRGGEAAPREAKGSRSGNREAKGGVPRCVSESPNAASTESPHTLKRLPVSSSLAAAEPPKRKAPAPVRKYLNLGADLGGGALKADDPRVLRAQV